jgi:hypothetical protein
MRFAVHVLIHFVLAIVAVHVDDGVGTSAQLDRE